jgi:hypothetical protein
MHDNALLEAGAPPADDRLRAVLGPAYDQFAAVRDAAPGFARGWKHHGKKYGWKYRVFRDDKSLLEVTVRPGALLVAIAVRQAEWQVLQTEAAHAELCRRVAAAGVVPEGYGVKLEIRDGEMGALALALIAFVAGQREEEDEE